MAARWLRASSDAAAMIRTVLGTVDDDGPRSA